MKTGMFRKLVREDIRNNKFSTGAIVLFSGISVMLFTLTIILFANLLGSIDRLMEKARTPDYLQMHAGAVVEKEIQEFAQANPQVKECQISRFLNLENDKIYLGEHCLVESTQDNGLSVQNPSFDLLLDENNQIPQVSEGEVYVPVCYRQQYDLHAGDLMKIGQQTLKIAGFIRDAQMNSMMASSKRFLVGEADYERFLEDGSQEYLIEFLLTEEADTGGFATAYVDAGLPTNGPAITGGLIKLMNALSDGMMIMIILLVSILVFVISAVCIRFILLTRVEREKKEIGMLKALGIARREVRKFYFGKYAVITCAGAVLGIGFAWGAYPVLAEKMQELYGTSVAVWQNALFSLLGAGFVIACMLWFVRGVLHKVEKITALDALLGREEKRGKGQKGYIAVIAAICTFLMVIPTNLNSTLESPEFVTYMGIGDGEIRIDIRQGENIGAVTQKLTEKLREDTEVEEFCLLQTGMEKIVTEEGNENLLVESGNHMVFPVSYSKGRAPQKEDEMAVSALEAQELSVSVGDQIPLAEDNGETSYRVCGIYSDITNGGKTAKRCSGEGQSADGDIMWNIMYITLKENSDKAAWVESYREWAAKIAGDALQQSAAVKIVSIKDYVQATYGQTMEQVSKAATMTSVVAAAILFVVIILFLKLLVARKAYGISLEKALGFENRDIIRKYFYMGTGCAVVGEAAGIVLGNLLGERICGMALKSFGAEGFRFVCDWTQILIRIPGIALVAAILAVWIGTSDIYSLKAYECCRDRE